MRRPPRTFLMALLAAVVSLAAAGCGGSQVSADEVPGSPPALTVPVDSELGAAGSNADAGSSADGSADSASGGASADAGAADSSTAAAGTTPAPADTSGGAAAPTPEATTAPEDTTGGAAPPPAGSAPEQFENFCEQNAGAC